MPDGDERRTGRRAHHHQEIRQPAALQHALVELHHARRPVADDPRGDRFPGARRQDRQRHHPPDPHPDHHGGGSARRADAADQLPAPADLDVRQLDAGADAALPRSDDGQFPRQPAQAAGDLEGEHGARRAGQDGRDQHGDVQGRRERVHARRQAVRRGTAGRAARAAASDDLDALRAQMAAMQKKLDELGK